MRVIAGSRRSMPLKAPTGLDTRPTQDRTKETLFNVLQNNVPGCVFADLFSGSGGIGIEALSRGAKSATFVDSDFTSCELTKKNLLNLDCMTVSGKTVGENIAGCVNKNPEVIRPLENPYSETGGLAALKGNLAPDSGIVKEAKLLGICFGD